MGWTVRAPRRAKRRKARVPRMRPMPQMRKGQARATGRLTPAAVAALHALPQPWDVRAGSDYVDALAAFVRGVRQGAVIDLHPWVDTLPIAAAALPLPCLRRVEDYLQGRLGDGHGDPDRVSLHRTRRDI